MSDVLLQAKNLSIRYLDSREWVVRDFCAAAPAWARAP